MKKLLMTFVLVFAVAAVAQTEQQQPSAPQGAGQAAQPGAGQPAQQPAQQKKEIKNPAEYNAYMAAINSQEPAAKAQGLESFLQQYPNSVMKPDALELLMRTYQQLGNQQKTEETANALLQVSPNNVTALALLSYLDRAKAQSGQDVQTNLASARQFGERGLQALQSFQKPEGMADPDFEKLKQQLSGIFNASIGIAAYTQKDFPTAQKALQEAANITPNDFSIVYPLALSFLDAPQPVWLQGIWYTARAANLAPTPQLKAQISEYGRRKYIKYHGGDDGWTNVLASAATSPAPPQGFTVAPAPTPAEQAAKMVQAKPVAQMSFDEIQFILTSGNQQAADQVWNEIKGKPIAMLGVVVTASPTSLTIAGTYDDINNKDAAGNPAPKADITLAMSADIPAKLMPKVGAQLQFQGVPVSYTPNPFMMQMDHGQLVTTKKEEPARRTPAHHTATHK